MVQHAHLQHCALQALTYDVRKQREKEAASFRRTGAAISIQAAARGMHCRNRQRAIAAARALLLNAPKIRGKIMRPPERDDFDREYSQHAKGRQSMLKAAIAGVRRKLPGLARDSSSAAAESRASMLGLGRDLSRAGPSWDLARAGPSMELQPAASATVGLLSRFGSSALAREGSAGLPREDSGLPRKSILVRDSTGSSVARRRSSMLGTQVSFDLSRQGLLSEGSTTALLDRASSTGARRSSLRVSPAPQQLLRASAVLPGIDRRSSGLVIVSPGSEAEYLLETPGTVAMQPMHRTQRSIPSQTHQGGDTVTLHRTPGDATAESALLSSAGIHLDSGHNFVADSQRPSL